MTIGKVLRETEKGSEISSFKGFLQSLCTVSTLSNMFLEGLDDRLRQWSDLASIGDMFQHYSAFFRVYQDYAANYSFGKATILQYRESKAYFEVLCKEFEERSGSLEDALRTPFQVCVSPFFFCFSFAFFILS